VTIKGRLILDSPAEGSLNMAVDERLFREASEKPDFLPTLRIYGWIRPTVSLGRRQNLDDVNLRACRSAGIDVVKRFGGGAAVYHHLEEITYCFVTRPDVFPIPSGNRWREIFCSLLEKLGLESEPCRSNRQASQTTCFSSAEADEPTIGGGKWVGSARRKSRTAYLQHGSILLKRQPELMSRIIKEPAPDSSIGLADLIPGLEKDDVIPAFIEAVELVFAIQLESITEQEIVDADYL